MVPFEVTGSWHESAGLIYKFDTLGVLLFQGGGREPEELDAWIVDQAPLPHGSLTYNANSFHPKQNTHEIYLRLSDAIKSFSIMRSKSERVPSSYLQTPRWI